MDEQLAKALQTLGCVIIPDTNVIVYPWSPSMNTRITDGINILTAIYDAGYRQTYLVSRNSVAVAKVEVEKNHA